MNREYTQAKSQGGFERGFTIVELLIVIVVIAILAAVTIVAFNGISERAKNAGITSSVANVIKQFELTKVDTDAYPMQSYILANLKGFPPSASGIGNYFKMQTYIANISDVREAIAAKGLKIEDIGALNYTYSSGVLGASQDSSVGGYLQYPTYSSNNTDSRVAPYLAAATTLDEKISAYDRYQKEVLGLVTIPSTYKSGNVFIATAAVGAARDTPQKRAYPFIELTTYCNRTTAQCFTSLGYYLYGKDTACPNLGVGSVKTPDNLSNSYGVDAGKKHNMTFCLSYLGGMPPASFSS